MKNINREQLLKREEEIKVSAAHDYAAKRWEMVRRHVYPFVQGFGLVMLRDIRQELFSRSNLDEFTHNIETIEDFLNEANSAILVDAINEHIDNIVEKYIIDNVDNERLKVDCVYKGIQIYCLPPSKKDSVDLFRVFENMIDEYRQAAQNILLYDDETPFGGISFDGYTLDDFLCETLGGYDTMQDQDYLNKMLRESGILPVSIEDIF